MKSILRPQFKAPIQKRFRDENRRRQTYTVPLVGVHINWILRPSYPHQLHSAGTMDPFSNLDVRFSPIHGDLILDDPLQFYLEPEQDASVPEGVIAPILSSRFDTDTIEKGRGIDIDEEVQHDSDLGVPLTHLRIS